MLLNSMSIEVYKEGSTRYICYNLLEPSYDSCDTSLYMIDYWNEKLLILNNGEDDLFEFLNNQEFEEIDITFNYPNNNTYNAINRKEFKEWVIHYSNDSETPLSQALRNCIVDM